MWWRPPDPGTVRANPLRRGRWTLWVALLLAGFAAPAAQVDAGEPEPLFNDVHFHLLDYVQRRITARAYLDMVGDRVGRVAMFGIPLQQKWDYFVSGERAPRYYLHSDSALYCYSFVDAVIAREYLSLSEAERRRIDPMRTHVVYEPLWERLATEVRARVERRNYERVFDAAVPRVRAWEQRQLSNQSSLGR